MFSFGALRIKSQFIHTELTDCCWWVGGRGDDGVTLLDHVMAIVKDRKRMKKSGRFLVQNRGLEKLKRLRRGVEEKATGELLRR